MGRHLLSADWSPEMRATLGQRFLRRMKELNLQAKDVVDRFNDLRERKLPPHLLPVIRQLEMGNGRSRVSRIAHGQPIELFQEEAELWAGALDGLWSNGSRRMRTEGMTGSRNAWPNLLLFLRHMKPGQKKSWVTVPSFRAVWNRRSS